MSKTKIFSSETSKILTEGVSTLKTIKRQKFLGITFFKKVIKNEIVEVTDCVEEPE